MFYIVFFNDLIEIMKTKLNRIDLLIFKDKH